MGPNATYDHSLTVSLEKYSSPKSMIGAEDEYSIHRHIHLVTETGNDVLMEAGGGVHDARRDTGPIGKT